MQPKHLSLAERPLNLAERLGYELRNRGLTITVAESCTGGGLASAITDVAGSSDWFEAGFVVYSNKMKTELLGVDKSLIDRYGAVSEQVTQAMVAGALRQSRANVGIAISGIAGPGGGSHEKPVGTVCFTVATSADNTSETCLFEGPRAEVRSAAIIRAFKLLLKFVDQKF